MTTIGLLIVLTGFISYIVLLFVIHRFTYRTWIFDTVIGLGIATAFAGFSTGDDITKAVFAIILGIAWFPITRHELRLTGSKRLNLGIDDRTPAMNLLTTENKIVTEKDLIAQAPTLLVFYRGWWLPIEQITA